MRHGANDAGHDNGDPQRHGSEGIGSDDAAGSRSGQQDQQSRHGQPGTTGQSQWGQPAPQQPPGQQGQPAWGQPPVWGQPSAWEQPGPAPEQPTWAQPGQQPPAAPNGWTQQTWGQPAPGQPPHQQPGVWPGQPAWGNHPGGGWPAPGGAGPYRGYVAPPKPGVIPLRPLGVGEILDGAFQAARKNAAAVFGTAVLLQVVVSALAWLVGGLIISAFGGLQVMANEELTDESALAFGLSIIISSLVLGLLSGVGVLVLQGVLAIPTARAAVNQTTSFGLMFALAKGRIGALIGLGLLYLALSAAALAAIIAGSFFLADQLGVTSVWVIVLIILGLTVVSVWIGIKLMLAPAVIIMERAPLFRSLARSWQLTNRNWWRTFGIILLCTIIVTVITSVVSMPISFIVGLAGPLMGDPTSPESMLATMGPLTLVSMLLSSIFSAIGYAFQAAVIALVYMDLRIRREGFDVVLLREHEASGGQDTRTIPGLGTSAAPGSTVPGQTGPWGP